MDRTCFLRATLNLLQVKAGFLRSGGSSLKDSTACAEKLVVFLNNGPLCLSVMAVTPLGCLDSTIENMFFKAIEDCPDMDFFTKLRRLIRAICSDQERLHEYTLESQLKDVL